MKPIDVKCDQCGAAPGERCHPKTVLIGYHAPRVRATGVELKSPWPDRRSVRDEIAEWCAARPGAR